VPSDLAFLQATRGQLDAIDPQLISLIAHDRAGFGGALASAGAALLLVALRGIKRGDRRLWWTLAAAGLPGFAATIVIHAGVGYTDLMHLAPVLVAAALYTGALACLYPFMNGPLWAPAMPWRASPRPPRA
jgi:dihydroorotate dehydrogenase